MLFVIKERESIFIPKAGKSAQSARQVALLALIVELYFLTIHTMRVMDIAKNVHQIIKISASTLNCTYYKASCLTAGAFIMECSKKKQRIHSPAFSSQKSLMNFLIAAVGVVSRSAHFALNFSSTSGFRSSGNRTYFSRRCFC